MEDERRSGGRYPPPGGTLKFSVIDRSALLNAPDSHVQILETTRAALEDLHPSRSACDADGLFSSLMAMMVGLQETSVKLK